MGQTPTLFCAEQRIGNDVPESLIQLAIRFSNVKFGDQAQLSRRYQILQMHSQSRPYIQNFFGTDQTTNLPVFIKVIKKNHSDESVLQAIYKMLERQEVSQRSNPTLAIFSCNDRTQTSFYLIEEYLTRAPFPWNVSRIASQLLKTPLNQRKLSLQNVFWDGEGVTITDSITDFAEQKEMKNSRKPQQQYVRKPDLHQVGAFVKLLMTGSDKCTAEELEWMEDEEEEGNAVDFIRTTQLYSSQNDQNGRDNVQIAIDTHAFLSENRHAEEFAMALCRHIMASLLHYYNSEGHMLHDIAGRLKHIVKEQRSLNGSGKRLSLEMFRELTQHHISQPYIFLILQSLENQPLNSQGIDKQAIETACRYAFDQRRLELLESVFNQLDFKQETFLKRISFQRFLTKNSKEFGKIRTQFARNLDEYVSNVDSARFDKIFAKEFKNMMHHLLQNNQQQAQFSARKTPFKMKQQIFSNSFTGPNNQLIEQAMMDGNYMMGTGSTTFTNGAVNFGQAALMLNNQTSGGQNWKLQNTLINRATVGPISHQHKSSSSSFSLGKEVFQMSNQNITPRSAIDRHEQFEASNYYSP